MRVKNRNGITEQAQETEVTAQLEATHSQKARPMTVLLLHGWFCDAARKEVYLRSLGFEVVRPKLSNWSFRQAVSAARQAYEQSRPDVIVASSRGGAVAMNFDSEGTPMVLLSPAYRRFGRVRKLDKPAVVIHGLRDRLIWVSGSDKLCRISSGATLLIVDDGHRLRSPEGRKALRRGLEIALGSIPVAAGPNKK